MHASSVSNLSNGNPIILINSWSTGCPDGALARDNGELSLFAGFPLPKWGKWLWRLAGCCCNTQEDPCTIPVSTNKQQEHYARTLEWSSLMTDEQPKWSPLHIFFSEPTRSEIRTTADRFSDYLRDYSWEIGVCDDDFVILISVEDRVVSTEYL